jgi:hypothetical protein
VNVNDVLLSHQRAELDSAVGWRLATIIAQLLVAGIAAISVYSNDGKVLLTLAIAGAILTIGWFYADRRYRRYRAAGDQARRLLLVSYGLAQGTTDIANFVDRFTAPVQDKHRSSVEDYFDTRAAAGGARLAEMIDESAFWTGALQGRSGERLTLALLMIAALAVIALLTTAHRTEFSTLIDIARVSLAFLVFLLSSDILGSAVSHREAALEIERIRLRLDASRARGFPIHDVLGLMADYDSAVEAAPMTLPWLYKTSGKRIRESWRTYKVARGIGS